jgi:hypothetical protein
MPVRQIAGATVAYDASGVEKSSRRPKTRKRTCRVTTLRSERGYLARNYDGSAAKRAKPLRRHFGKFYDAKKVRNIQLTGFSESTR